MVGQQPMLAPGERLPIVGLPLGTPFGVMEGTYQMVTREGEQFDAKIAPFTLSEPYTVRLEASSMIPADALLNAYASGWFPMAIRSWGNPLVLAGSARHHPARHLSCAPRGWRASLRRGPSRIRDRHRLPRRHPRLRRGGPGIVNGNWIDEEIIDSYCALQRTGVSRTRSRRGATGWDSSGGLSGVADARRVLRRVDVSPCDRRVEASARRAGSAPARAWRTCCSTRSG